MKKKGDELRAKCADCDKKLIVVRENDKVIVAKCPRCKQEFYFTRVRRYKE